MDVVSKAKFVRTPPDKVRILAGIIKNKPIDTSIVQLSFSGRAAAKPLILVLKQAKAQLKDKNQETEKFRVKTVQVDEGPKLKRRRILHQGRATMILKRMSHITVIVSDNGNPKSEVRNENPKERKEKNGTKS